MRGRLALGLLVAALAGAARGGTFPCGKYVSLNKVAQGNGQSLQLGDILKVTGDADTAEWLQFSLQGAPDGKLMKLQALPYAMEVLMFHTKHKNCSVSRTIPLATRGFQNYGFTRQAHESYFRMKVRNPNAFLSMYIFAMKSAPSGPACDGCKLPGCFCAYDANNTPQPSCFSGFTGAPPLCQGEGKTIKTLRAGSPLSEQNVTILMANPWALPIYKIPLKPGKMVKFTARQNCSTNTSRGDEMWVFTGMGGGYPSPYADYAELQTNYTVGTPGNVYCLPKDHKKDEFIYVQVYRSHYSCKDGASLELSVSEEMDYPKDSTHVSGKVAIGSVGISAAQVDKGHDLYVCPRPPLPNATFPGMPGRNQGDDLEITLAMPKVAPVMTARMDLVLDTNDWPYINFTQFYGVNYSTAFKGKGHKSFQQEGNALNLLHFETSVMSPYGSVKINIQKHKEDAKLATPDLTVGMDENPDVAICFPQHLGKGIESYPRHIRDLIPTSELELFDAMMVAELGAGSFVFINILLAELWSGESHAWKFGAKYQINYAVSDTKMLTSPIATQLGMPQVMEYMKANPNAKPSNMVSLTADSHKNFSFVPFTPPAGGKFMTFACSAEPYLTKDKDSKVADLTAGFVGVYQVPVSPPVPQPPSPAPKAKPAEDGGGSNAGLAIGLTVGVLALVGAGVGGFLVYRKRHKGGFNEIS